MQNINYGTEKKTILMEINDENLSKKNISNHLKVERGKNFSCTRSCDSAMIRAR